MSLLSVMLSHGVTRCSEITRLWYWNNLFLFCQKIHNICIIALNWRYQLGPMIIKCLLVHCCSICAVQCPDRASVVFPQSTEFNLVPLRAQLFCSVTRSRFENEAMVCTVTNDSAVNIQFYLGLLVFIFQHFVLMDLCRSELWRIAANVISEWSKGHPWTGKYEQLSGGAPREADASTCGTYLYLLDVHQQGHVWGWSDHSPGYEKQHKCECSLLVSQWGRESSVSRC